MTRSIQDLHANSLLFWPNELSQREQNSSIIPKLIETQESFIALLSFSDASPVAWHGALESCGNMPGNLFLKHLMVLSDVGGEKLQRFKQNLSTLFPNYNMEYVWRGNTYTYEFFGSNRIANWTNTGLYVDGVGLNAPREMTRDMFDVAMLLIHGASTVNNALPDYIYEKCIIGSLIGNVPEINKFVKERYIHVSRITGGATANALGQLCQAYVKERLSARLPEWDFSRHTIPGISQNDNRTDTSFDIVSLSPAGHYCAIEVSFQVTTNSTIERKAGQAGARRDALNSAGHNIAYVIDGAGNFQRSSALTTICQNSDFTVSFKDEEIDSLANFLRSLG